MHLSLFDVEKLTVKESWQADGNQQVINIRIATEEGYVSINLFVADYAVVRGYEQ